MAAISDFLEAELLDHVLRNSAYTPPANVYLALYINSPGDNDTGTEVTGGGYARQTVSFNRTGSTVTNNADIVFPLASTSWGTITHLGIRDAANAGNLLFWAQAAVSKQIDQGDQLIIKSGDLSVSLD